MLRVLSAPLSHTWHYASSQAQDSTREPDRAMKGYRCSHIDNVSSAMSLEHQLNESEIRQLIKCKAREPWGTKYNNVLKGR